MSCDTRHTIKYCVSWVRAMRGNDTGMEIDDPQSVSAGGGKGSAFAARDANPPQKKFRLTDRMKEKIWDLVCLTNEMCRIENEKK